MNICMLIGRMTKDAELKFTPGKGTAVATFSIAVDNGYGENKTTAFIPVVVWGKAAESVATYTHKGSLVAVKGRINTRSYDAKDGTKRYVTEVVADNYEGIKFLDSKGTGQNNNTESDIKNTFGADITRIADDDKYGSEITPVDDGDIPF